MQSPFGNRSTAFVVFVTSLLVWGCAETDQPAPAPAQVAEEPSNRKHFEDEIFNGKKYLVFTTSTSRFFSGCEVVGGQIILTKNSTGTVCAKNSIGLGWSDKRKKLNLVGGGKFTLIKHSNSHSYLFIASAEIIPDTFNRLPRVLTLLPSRQFLFPASSRDTISIIGDPTDPDNDPNALAVEFMKTYPGIDPARVVVGQPHEFDCESRTLKSTENIFNIENTTRQIICDLQPVQ